MSILLLIFMYICNLYAASSSGTPQSEALNLLLIGDWGGVSNSPYVTSAQLSVASGMNTIASDKNVSAVLSLGDNFYSNGVKSTSSIRFNKTFRDVYNGNYIKHLPWYLVLGNHDYSGNIQAQIDYSNVNPIWNMPSRYYAFNVSSPDNSLTLNFIMIDTIELSDLTSSSFKQFDWIEQELNKSTAPYTIVAGHYPVYSVCSHGNTPSLVKYLEPLLKKYKAIYLSGHDHCQEYLINDDINYIVSGMGKMCCYSASNLNSNPVQQVRWYFSSETQTKSHSNVDGGFSLLSATNTSLHVTYYDQDGNVLYVTPDIYPSDCKVNCTNGTEDIRNDGSKNLHLHSQKNLLFIFFAILSSCFMIMSCY